MIAVMVRFQYENEFNEAQLQQIAEGARRRVSRHASSTIKTFTVDAARRQASTSTFGSQKTLQEVLLAAND